MRELLSLQSGVVSRAQLHALGCQDHDVRRLVRRRDLTPLRRGVFVDHTGEPTWLQQAWGAVLLCRAKHDTAGVPIRESAALRGASALVAASVAPSPAGDVRWEVVVADDRRLTTPADIDARRSSSELALVQWHLRPPRVHLEEAVLDVAARQSRMVDTVAEVSRAVGSRRTTAGRLLSRLDQRDRVPQRGVIRAVLRDLTEGTCSALEHGYLTRVERPHGLPHPVRQARGRSRTAVVYRDAEYDGLVLELDGRAWHDSVGHRDRDADRDLLAAVAGKTTVRLTWGQVFDRSCWTAAQVARLLDVRPRRCGSLCPAPDL